MRPFGDFQTMRLSKAIKEMQRRKLSLHSNRFSSHPEMLFNWWFQTAETLQIKGLAEKFTETMRNNSSNRRLLASASFSSSRYLSVPSQYSSGSRQLSTESLPEDYLRRYLIFLIIDVIATFRLSTRLTFSQSWKKIDMIAITLLVEPILLGKPQWSPDSIRSNLAYLAQRLMQPKELCHPLSVRHECNFAKSSDECLAVAAVSWCKIPVTFVLSRIGF